MIASDETMKRVAIALERLAAAVEERNRLDSLPVEDGLPIEVRKDYCPLCERTHSVPMCSPRFE